MLNKMKHIWLYGFLDSDLEMGIVALQKDMTCQHTFVSQPFVSKENFDRLVSFILNNSWILLV